MHAPTPPPGNSVLVEPQFKPLNARAAAIGLLIATIIGYSAILIPFATRPLQAGPGTRWDNLRVGIGLFAMAIVLALPGVLWYRKRAAAWAQWHPTAATPWLAWGPRLLVVCGLLVAGKLQDSLSSLSQVIFFLSGDDKPWRWITAQTYSFLQALVVGIGASICFVGLAASGTPDALSKWIQRAFYLVCAFCALNGLAWFITMVQQSLRS